MKRTFALIVLSFITALTAMAQDAQPKKAGTPRLSEGSEVPSADQILNKYVQAIGGKAVVEKIKTRLIKGSVVTGGGSAPLQIFEKAPNKFYRQIESPVSGTSENGFNGTVAWSKNQRGLREVSGPEIASAKREYHLHREIELKEFYPQMTVKGKEKVGDREAYVIEAASADGTSEKLYFDAQTWLLTRWDVSIRGTTVQTDYEDYKEVDGIRLAFTLRRSRADFSWTDKIDEIKHDLPIADTKFDKPTAQQE